MQLTKAEIAETQIIVTTPEKWDVVTRKPTGEGELATVCTSPFAVVLFVEIFTESETADYRRGSPIE